VKALVFERNLPRSAAARVLSSFGSGRGAGIGPLRLVDTEAPELPGSEWHRVTPRLSGICGSDLSAIDGRTSRYFEDVVSFPFVPGHEIVGEVPLGAVDAAGEVLPPGSRVVVEPVLGCRARGIEPPCVECAAGRTGDCGNVAFGHLRPGLQTGFCADTGGGWSTAGLVAHASQLHRVPDDLSDETAVTVEPLACALHAALAGEVRDGDVVAVLGAGTVGLTVTAALAQLARTGRTPDASALLVGARYGHQRRLAEELGATTALEADQLPRAVRGRSRSLALGGPSGSARRLTGGADVVFDCVGSAESISRCLTMVRPRGRVVLVGMPGRLHIDLAPLWHREVALVGAYTYGTEHTPGGNGAAPNGAPVRTFDLALELAGAAGTGRLVSATYPIDRFEEAVAHAGGAGRRGAVKVAFNLRADTRRTPPSAEKGPDQ
jgi:threonine dehydrogenase-like Zn-dependent dehydrogenase